MDISFIKLSTLYIYVYYLYLSFWCFYDISRGAFPITGASADSFWQQGIGPDISRGALPITGASADIEVSENCAAKFSDPALRF